MDQTGKSAYRVLGIDPGLHITGYAVVDFAGREPQIAEAGTIRSNTQADMSQRITQIYADLVEILAETKPNLVAIEQLYAHYKHPRTAILMGHARGVILLACQQAGISIANLAATNVKKSATGNGHATKLQVQRAIQAACRLDKLPEPPDVADAIAIALCAGRHKVHGF
jgi:crossover junction endodeoxyribonuclease RuvC